MKIFQDKTPARNNYKYPIAFQDKRDENIILIALGYDNILIIRLGISCISKRYNKFLNEDLFNLHVNKLYNDLNYRIVKLYFSGNAEIKIKDLITDYSDYPKFYEYQCENRGSAFALAINPKLCLIYASSLPEYEMGKLYHIDLRQWVELCANSELMRLKYKEFFENFPVQKYTLKSTNLYSFPTVCKNKDATFLFINENEGFVLDSQNHNKYEIGKHYYLSLFDPENELVAIEYEISCKA